MASARRSTLRDACWWWTLTRRRQLVVYGAVVGSLVTMAAVPVVVAWSQVLWPPRDALPTSADAVVVFAGESSRLGLATDLAADGRAPVLVISLGSPDAVPGPPCGQEHPYRIVCVAPRRADTKAEAEAFADVIRANGWASVIAVTSDFHGARARLWLGRCTPAEISFALVDQPRPRRRVIRHEIGGLLEARLLDRTC